MADLSPAAKAVFDALNMSELNGPQQYMALAHAAAAIRAAALGVYSEEYVTCGGASYALMIEVDDLLAIADELQTP